ncbi:MAG: alpha/beta hydrolase [Pseudomonas sp.]|uniref:alpha/beta hydrolase n=1 Tax=Pseudomonas sp. TaxID=306 RepID=UPI00271D6C5D|nr:alpha/beta hydrolase [Pseudomonas sp.]MDO9619727.1 alpha/beta hydrolase [Pseudomonas sp.]MDP2444534.1 alpha/beta hydrolase [Pseudomonas sp.]
MCWLSGCTQPMHLQGSRLQTEAWVMARGWSPVALEVQPFNLLGLLRQTAASQTLTLYIEGDGAPWPSVYRPPQDPTPIRPLALLLAERDTAVAVAYLGRPCQYLNSSELRQCSPLYWSERRFSAEVLQAMDRALSELKQQAGAERLRLVGYSGGGVLATLLAQRRDDVELLVTLAAPLALNEWTRRLQLSPLHGSLDPLDGPRQRARALHFSGAMDQVVPTAVVEYYVARHGGRLEQLPGFDHACCWLHHWPELLTGLEGRQ